MGPQSHVSLQSALKAVQTIIGYNFKNPRLLQEALQAPGIQKREGHLPLPAGHKRLASVGDSVLALLIRERLYHSKFSAGKSANDKFLLNELIVRPKITQVEYLTDLFLILILYKLASGMESIHISRYILKRLSLAPL